MIRQSLILLVAGVAALQSFHVEALGADTGKAITPATAGVVSAWPVITSLKSTLRDWAERQGWPAPQFLTDADWPVDVPGSIPGSIENALHVLTQGFSRAASRPRIELTVNHVIVVSEMGAE